MADEIRSQHSSEGASNRRNFYCGRTIAFERVKPELDDLTGMDRDAAVSVIVEKWGDVRQLISTYRISLKLVGENLKPIDSADIRGLGDMVG